MTRSDLLLSACALLFVLGRGRGVLHGSLVVSMYILVFFFLFQAEDGIRDLVRSRGLGDVYKRQLFDLRGMTVGAADAIRRHRAHDLATEQVRSQGLALSLIHI